MADQRKELAKYLDELEQRGYVILGGGDRHFQVRNYNGRMIAIIGTTPSDCRALRNLRADVKRYEREVASERQRADEFHQGSSEDSQRSQVFTRA